jgi:hypothetical protein
MRIIDTLEIWGPGGDYAFLVVTPVDGPEVLYTIGARPGAITLRREFDSTSGEAVFIDVSGDNGTAWLKMSVESAAKLAEALASLAKNAYGEQN